MKIQFIEVSLIILIAVNLLPIFGVIYSDWDVFEIVALYWFENVVIGLVNVLKIITCCPRSVLSDEDKKLPEYFQPQASTGSIHHLAKLFLVSFFTVHYGMFCLVHGVFVFALLGPDGEGNSPFVNMGDWFGSFLNTDTNAKIL